MGIFFSLIVCSRPMWVNMLTCNLVWRKMMTSSVKMRGCPLTTNGPLVKGAKYRKLPHMDRMIRRLLPTYHSPLTLWSRVLNGESQRVIDGDIVI